MSAPFAPAAKPGWTYNIPLPGITSPNPITQFVSPATLQIVNITQRGHVFNPGDSRDEGRDAPHREQDVGVRIIRIIPMDREVSDHAAGDELSLHILAQQGHC